MVVEVHAPNVTRTVIVGVLVLVSFTAACNQSVRADDRSAEAFAVIDRPPVPSFTEPVDYVAWYSDRRFEDDWPCGEDIYPFLYDPEAKELFKLDKEVSKALSVASKGPWSPQEMPELVQLLRTLDPYLQAYARVAETDHVRWYCRADSLWLGPHPDYTASPVLAKALLANAWMDVSPHRPGPTMLMDAIKTNFRHARHIGSACGTIAFLINMGVRSDTYKSIQRAFDNGALSSENASAVMDLLETHDGPTDIAEAYRCEWAGFLDMIQQLYPKGSFSDSAAKALDVAEYLPPGGVFLPRPEKSAARASEFLGPMVKAAELPMSTAAYRDICKQGEKREKAAGMNLLLTTFLPASVRAYVFGMAIETERRATMLLVSTYAFREKHGRWPESLREIEVPSPNIRIDPFLEREFTYELRGEQPWLYSVGLDGKDDGGNHDPRAYGKEGHDLVFLPVQKDH